MAGKALVVLSKRIRILHVIVTIDRGGAENHLIDLACAQKESGHHVAVAWLKGGGYWRTRLKSAGIETYDLGLKFYGHLAPAIRLAKAIRTFKPDLLHAHLPPAELYTHLSQMVPGRKRLPLVVTKHNDSPFIDSKGWNPGGNWSLSRTDALIGISHAVRSYFTKPGVTLTPLGAHTIHYGINPSIYEDVKSSDINKLRESWGANSETLVFGTVARLVPQKNLQMMIDAFAKFCADSPDLDTRLVFVGRGPLDTNLKEHATKLDVADKIHWAGFQENIPLIMASFDVFLLSSEYEGFGLVLLEAMAASKPIVATRVSAIPEIVEEGKTGMLVEPRDSAAMAISMARMKDKSYRKRLGSAGLARAKSSFGIDRMRRETDRIYELTLSSDPYQDS